VSAGRAFRKLIADEGQVIVPGAFAPLIAQIVEALGFSAVYMTGGGTSSVLLGVPDVGYATMPENITNARNMVLSMTLPVIADMDTGYGGLLNVFRTVREYRMTGVAAVHMEDQGFPKKCGWHEGVEVVPLGQMVAKIEVAMEAREDDDLFFIARTDALKPEGVDSAIERGLAYAEAGADAIWVESLLVPEDVVKIGEQLGKRIPIVMNMGSGSYGPYRPASEVPPLPLKQMEDLGYRILVYPSVAALAMTKSVEDVLQILKTKGFVGEVAGSLATLDHYQQLGGLAAIQQREDKYSDVMS
jgi:2-methylisocitrate lyase-like PEP mutase family enzyme